jgi:predicted SAM-dependent methyltransferase
MFLNIGSGFSKIIGAINIDINSKSNPDVIADLTNLPFITCYADRIKAHHVLEHICQSKVVEAMNELHRVLKIGGVLDIEIPSTDGRGAFQDPTHRSYWNYNSFLYYTDTLYRRQADIKAVFEIAHLSERNVGSGIVVVTAILKKIEEQKCYLS